jgi:multisubunit Na+/H+ antiporter MnhF subunit
LINTLPHTLLKYMIDTWLFAVLCLIFLSICAVGRAIPGPTRDDQLIGVNTAITIAAGAALALSISWGNLFLLDVAIALTTLCYAGTIAYSRTLKGETL